jgi:hypothetical protein
LVSARARVLPTDAGGQVRALSDFDAAVLYRCASEEWSFEDPSAERNAILRLEARGLLVATPAGFDAYGRGLFNFYPTALAPLALRVHQAAKPYLINA